MNRSARVLGLLISGLVVALSQAQLRIGTWNVTNYTSGRVSEFQTAIYGSFEGRSFTPDVLLGQEFISAQSVVNFRTILNTAPGSPGDWAAAAFIDGADTDSAFFYRTSKVQYLGTTIVAVGSSATTNQPRNTYRYDFRPLGYSSTASTIACYSVHMKSGSTSEDQARRLVESQRIRDDAQALPLGTNFLIGGDFNIQSSSQAAYVELVGSQADNLGRFFDPISTPGGWNNNSAFRFVHTQDPAFQMDDRLDFILLSAGLRDANGMDYIGNPNLAYSTTTWDDPNHSYRSWGNDGSTFDHLLNTSTNAMVGNTIAQALVTSAAGGGHLPIFLDAKVPPVVSSAATIDFGIVPQFWAATRTLTVSNAGDLALWNASGIARLSYSLTSGGPFVAPTGTFFISAGASSNSHTLSMNTSTPGLKLGTVTIYSNDPDQPARIVNVRGRVIGRAINPIPWP